MSVNITTGKTLFKLIYGYLCVLSIETSIKTWNITIWGGVISRTDLLAARIKQIEQRDEELVEAAARAS